MTDNPIDVALLVTRVLEKLDIPYYIGGSIASTFYGKIRTTFDIDLIADLKPEHAAVLVQEFESIFYVDAEMILDSIRARRSFNLLHFNSMYKVDIFTPAPTSAVRSRFERRVRQVVNTETGESVYFASPEDTILAKLEWYQLGNRVSERQWTDILDVLRVQAGRLDLPYLRRWAAELHVADLLDKALAEAA